MNPRLETALVWAWDSLATIPTAAFLDRDAAYRGIVEAEAAICDAWTAAGGAVNMDGEPDLAAYRRVEGELNAADMSVHLYKDGAA